MPDVDRRILELIRRLHAATPADHPGVTLDYVVNHGLFGHWIEAQAAVDRLVANGLERGQQRAGTDQTNPTGGGKAVKRRPYTEAEIAYVREHYGKVRTIRIAIALGRKISSINQAARRYGVRILGRMGAADKMAIVRLHAEGLTDADIARRLGKWSRESVSENRRAMGLPINEAAQREVKRRAVRRQLESLGLKWPAELRTLAFRRFAKENGWPEGLTPRAVQILNVLADRGVPMTRRELAVAIGMRTDYHQSKILCGSAPGGTYTAYLMRLGLIQKLSVRRREGGYRWSNLYCLGPAALQILHEKSNECLANGTTTQSISTKPAR